MKKNLELVYRIAFIIVSGISIMLHFSLNDGDYNAHEFSFFTVQSNIFCFIVMIVLLIKYYNKKDIYSEWLIYFKGMALSAIICTFMVYHFAESCNKYPLMTIGIFGLPYKDLFAHYLTPFMFVLDWLLFQPKGHFQWKQIATWLVFPLSYFAGFMTRCYCNPDDAFLNVEKFPYYFLYFETLGTVRFIHYILLLAVILIAENTLIISIDKFLYRVKQKKKLNQNKLTDR